jgi:hypothetical protein
MRGVSDQGRLFSYISPEARVRADHPLRENAIRSPRSATIFPNCGPRVSLPNFRILAAINSSRRFTQFACCS